MSDKKNQQDGLGANNKSTIGSGNLFADDAIAENQSSFEIPDDEYDVKMWDEKEASALPNILKLIVMLGLLFAVGMFLYKFMQNPSKSSETNSPESAVFSDSDLSPSELEFTQNDSNSLANDDSSEQIPAAAQEAINDFLEREEASLNNNERIVENNLASDQRQQDDLLLSEVQQATERQNTQPQQVTQEQAEQQAKDAAQRQAQIEQERAAAQQLKAQREAAATEQAAEKERVRRAAEAKKAAELKAQAARQKAAQQQEAARIAAAKKTAQQASATTSVKLASSTSLKKMSSSAYAIQLIGMNNTDGFKQFVATLPRNLNVHTYQRIRQGKVWNVAVLAPYANADEARAAIKALPTKLQELKPWVKSLKVIQQQL